MLSLMREIWGHQGVSGFYLGFRINLFRILPNNAIMFMAYEFLSRYMADEYYKLKETWNH